jgi:hypothetical protein
MNRVSSKQTGVNIITLKPGDMFYRFEYETGCGGLRVAGFYGMVVDIGAKKGSSLVTCVNLSDGVMVCLNDQKVLSVRKLEIERGA